MKGRKDVDEPLDEREHARRPPPRDLEPVRAPIASLSAERTIAPDDLHPDTATERTLEGDRALLDGFRAGTAEALTEVFRLYAPLVARSLRAGVVVQVDGRPTRIEALLDEFDFENLVQETFARAFKESARLAYDGLRPYRSYIVTIAKNLLVDRARKAKRERRVSYTDEIEIYGGADETTPEAVAIDTELHRLLADYRASLSGDVLRVFLCRYEQERSLRDASKELKMSMWNLRRIDARIRVSLLQALRDAGFLEETDVSIGGAVLSRAGKRRKEES